MKLSIVTLLVSVTLLLSGCADEKVRVMQSPCVGLDDSPCGPKRQANPGMAAAPLQTEINA